MAGDSDRASIFLGEIVFSSFRSTKHTERLRGKLTILVPTYRFDTRARQSLAAMASLASEEIAVLIADNSVSKEKWDYLHALARLHTNIHIFSHRENIGAARNWAFLFEQATLDYYLVVGDDDMCTPPYVEGAVQLLERHVDASAAAGPFIMVTSANRMIPGNAGRTEDTPYERCIKFRIGGGNSLPNSMARRSAVQPFLDYLRGHPLQASFFDWLMSYTLLGQGKYYTVEMGCYLYDVSNWENAEMCWKNNAKFYVAAGLPESFTWLHELYWAVESAHFFRGTYSPIDDVQQRLDCAQFYYMNRMMEFRQVWEHPTLRPEIERLIAHRPDAAEALRALVANDDALHRSLFGWFCEVLAAFHPECALAYADYTSASLDRATAGQSAISVR